MIIERGGTLAKDGSDDDADPTNLVIVENRRPTHKRRSGGTGAPPPRVDDEEFVDGLWHVFSNWVVDCCEEEKLLPFDVKPKQEHNFNSHRDYLAYVPPKGIANPVFAQKYPKDEFTDNDKSLMQDYVKSLLGRGEDPKDVKSWEKLRASTLNPLSRFPVATLRSNFQKMDKIDTEESDDEEEEEEEAKEEKATTTTTAPAIVHNADSRYTADEDKALKQLLEDDDNLDLAISALAAKAAKMQVCPGRTIRSLTDRIKKLKHPPSIPISGMNRVKFTAEDDEIMLSWFKAWKKQRSGGLWGKTMWEEAAQRPILPGKTAEQLFNRFKNRLSKLLLAEGEFDADVTPAAAAAAEEEADFKWNIPKSPKKIPRKRQDDGAAAAGTPKKRVKTQVQEEEDKGGDAYAQEVLDRLLDNGNATVENVIDALFLTSGDEQVAARVLRGEPMDSKFDMWTKLEDEKLRKGESTGRPDESKRRRFLGL